jgi:hypothetical protein
VFERELPPLIRLAAAAPVGIAVSGLLTLLLGHLLGLNLLTLCVCGLLLLLVPLLLLRHHWSQIREEWRGLKRLRKPLMVNIGLLTLLLSLFFRRVAYITPDGICTGVVDNFADLPYHIGFIESFVRAANFPPMHPMYAGSRLTYPFLVDFQAGTLEVAGLPLLTALLVQNLLLSVSLASLLMAFTARITRSRVAGIFAPWLLLLSGGTGFLLLVPEVRESNKGFWGFLGDLPHDFTEWGTLLHWGNSLAFWFSTMRGMLLAAPVMVLVWWFWWSALRKPLTARRRLLAAGVLTGLLPLAHTHSFLCTFSMGFCLMLMGRRKFLRGNREWWVSWFGYLTVALLMAVPQLLLLFSGSQTQTDKFFGLSLGWMAKDAERDPVTYWLLNAGLFLPLLCMALMGRYHGRWLVRPALRRFYLPFLLCFFAPNIIKFAPWAWDSIKVLYVWYIASVPIVAVLLARLWRSRAVGGRAVATTAFVLLTFSGSLDVYRVASTHQNMVVINHEEMLFAEKMSAVLPRKTVVVCAPIHNSPLMLTGRTAFMNYPGFLWTNGLPYADREQEVMSIYRGGPAALTLLHQHGLHYLILGPQEDRWADDKKVTLGKAFYATFAVIAQQGEYRLYYIP